MQMPEMFNAQEVRPAMSGAGKLPISDDAGWPVIITSAEVKSTAANDGSYGLAFNMQITEGPNAGASGSHWINIKLVGKDQASEIGRSELSALCYVTGQLNLAQTEQLIGKPFRAIVKPGKDDKPEVKGFKDVNGNQPGTASVQAQQSAPVHSSPQPIAQPSAQPVVGLPSQPVGSTAPVANNPNATFTPGATSASPSW